jgi:hypothetical protein
MITPMRQPLRAALLLAAGVLMAFAAVVHATISVPHLREDMVEIHVRPTLLGAVSLGLYFGAFANFGMALVVLVAGARALRGGATDRSLLAIVAAVYVAFGVTSFFAWGGSAHTLGYALAGLVIGVAVALPEPGIRP